MSGVVGSTTPLLSISPDSVGRKNIITNTLHTFGDHVYIQLCICKTQMCMVANIILAYARLSKLAFLKDALSNDRGDQNENMRILF